MAAPPSRAKVVDLDWENEDEAIAPANTDNGERMSHCIIICCILVILAISVPIGGLLIDIGIDNGAEACERPPCQKTINNGIWVLVSGFVAVAVLIGILRMLKAGSNSKTKTTDSL